MSPYWSKSVISTKMADSQPVSARDASYWLAVASAPSSSRSNAATNLSMSSSTRSLDANSFLLSLRSNSNSSSFLDSNRSFFVQQQDVEKSPDIKTLSPPPSSLYDSSFFAPTSSRGHKKQSPSSRTGSRTGKKPVIVTEEVFEHQRYQMVLGWGAKGHLLPLDPDKYMRVLRHSRCKRQQQDDEMGLEWLPSWTFPSISLPIADAKVSATLKQRSRSATSAETPSNAKPVAQTATFALNGPRWEWISPWHLEVPLDAVDGWQYASSFSHFTPRPSLRSRGRSIDSLSQSNLQVNGEPPSSSPASTTGKRLRVRRRKWVRYRRLRSGQGNIASGTSSSAFDDAFLDSMSGWLRKRGHVRKNWKARYFVLEQSVLRYYTDSSCAKLRGEVLLFHPQTQVHYVDVHVAGGRDASFAIQVGPEYTLLLQAAQLRDRENWIYCIEDALLCRDSYHPTILRGPYFDLRESVAQRRLLSAEVLALDGTSFLDNFSGISHAHGGEMSDELSEEEDSDEKSESSSSHRPRRSDGSDVLRLWASLHAKPGGVLSAISGASPSLRYLLRTCDQFLASFTMRQQIAGFLHVFRQKYQHSGTSVTTSAWTRLSEPWTPGTGNESDSEHELREGSLSANFNDVTTLQDARSLLALKNYRFFLERALEVIMEHLSTTPRDDAINTKRTPTDEEWALARRAALYKLERRTFIPLQEIIYQFLGAESGPKRQEEERFETLRVMIASQSQSFLEIQPSHQSPSEWKSAISLLNSMDNYSLPSEKAAVLVEVARCIYETHAREHKMEHQRHSSEKQLTPMAADDFLPIFIFVLARCHLRSVIVTRHLISETMITALMIGETGYYATMLEAAIGYIAAFDGIEKEEDFHTCSGSTALSGY